MFDEESPKKLEPSLPDLTPFGLCPRSLSPPNHDHDSISPLYKSMEVRSNLLPSLQTSPPPCLLPYDRLLRSSFSLSLHCLSPLPFPPRPSFLDTYIRGLISIVSSSVAIGALSLFVYGIDYGYLGGVLAVPEFIEKYGTLDPSTGLTTLHSDRLSLLTSTVYIGTVFGCFLAPFVSARSTPLSSTLICSVSEQHVLTLPALPPSSCSFKSARSGVSSPGASPSASLERCR